MTTMQNVHTIQNRAINVLVRRSITLPVNIKSDSSCQPCLSPRRISLSESCCRLSRSEPPISYTYNDTKNVTNKAIVYVVKSKNCLMFLICWKQCTRDINQEHSGSLAMQSKCGMQTHWPLITISYTKNRHSSEF